MVASVGVALTGLFRPEALVIVVAAATAWSVGVAAASMSPSWQWFGAVELRGEGRRAEVALTFDDGPHPDSTPKLLHDLREAGMRATFFLLADRADRWPELARRIALEGHEIALHGATHHPWLTLRPVADGARELSRAADHLEELTGSRPARFRPPFGAVSPRVLKAAHAAALRPCWASVRTFDGNPRLVGGVRARAARAVAGDILLMHEGDGPGVAVVRDVLADLRARGLRSVTVGELMS
ncbi:MAG: polysaccharide deacetylase family protein [Alphaproteobacteria bacterium]|nr:polysaccharide deacetylase family protein [Alphaproteobacteria bacterium]MCB9695602.1 polysaccharide deacetylase family protein [Alphaproteobacteria bacterium]